MRVLVTGGAGFIGSTVASALLDRGHHPVLLDDLAAGRAEFARDRDFYQGDIADAALLDRILDEHPTIEAVVHCAALTSVPDSVKQPLDYYRTNVAGTLELLQVLVRRGITRLIFSGSAAVYGPNTGLVVDETTPLEPTSPYARTKAMVESILEDVSAATPLQVLSLRYFNPIGADPQLRSGPQAPRPAHALGVLWGCAQDGTPFPIHGTDYPTRDGTGLRDYVHVWDLADAHVRAVERFDAVLDGHDYRVVNLGSGVGTTVRELVAAFEEVRGEPVPVDLLPRRPGDIAGACARGDLARELLGWTPQLSVRDGIADALAWFEARGQVLSDLSPAAEPAPGP